MKIFGHSIVVCLIILPLLYLHYPNAVQNTKSDISTSISPKTEVPMPTFESSKYFPIDTVTNLDFTSFSASIKKLDVTIQNERNLLPTDFLSTWDALIINASELDKFFGTKKMLLGLASSFSELESWQKDKGIKSIEHYLMQIKRLVPLFSKSLFAQQNSYLQQISNLVIDIQNSSYSNPTMTRAGKEKLLKLLLPINTTLKELAIVDRAGQKIVSDVTRLNEMALQLEAKPVVSNIVPIKKAVPATTESFSAQNLIGTPKAKIILTFYLVLLFLSYLSWSFFGAHRKQSTTPVVSEEKNILTLPVLPAEIEYFDLHQTVKNVLNDINEAGDSSDLAITLVASSALLIEGERKSAYSEIRNVLYSVVNHVKRYSAQKNIKIILKHEFGHVVLEARYCSSHQNIEAIPLRIELEHCKPSFGEISLKNLYDEQGALLFSSVSLNVEAKQSTSL